MSDITTNSSGPPQQAAQADTSSDNQRAYPKIWMVILYAFIAIVFTALWLGAYGWLNNAIWNNSFVTSNKWTIPVGVLFFSLLVGLVQKYLRAPTVIDGGAMASMKGGGHEKTDYTTFPGALLSSFFSLLSGASVGPEGALGALVQDITAWITEKLKVPEKSKLGLSLAALASAYNGIIGSPLFTGVLATEFQIGGKELGVAFLAWNLLAGVIGYFFFTLLKLPVFAKAIPFTPISTLTLQYALYAILLGLVGALLTLFIAVSFQVFGRVMGRFGEQGRPANHGRGGGHRHRGLFLPGVDVRRVLTNQANHPKSCILWCSAVAALCAAQDLAARTVVQEWVPGWPDIPNVVYLHDGRDGAEPALPVHPGVHPRAVY